MKKQNYTFEFNITFGTFENIDVPYKLILVSPSLFDTVKKLGEFYFRLKIVSCYNITGGMKKEIVELREVKTHDFNGNRYDIIKQLIFNYSENQRTISKKFKK